jgi:hypothetical protein
MKKNYLLILVASVILFVGCVNGLKTDNISVVKPEPKWLANPYIDNDEYAAVGCSYKHTNGVTAQKKLAISRAIDSIATQKRVTVDNVNLRRKHLSNGGNINSSLESTSLHTVNNLSVSTKTKAIYTKKDGEICAWVVSR